VALLLNRQSRRNKKLKTMKKKCFFFGFFILSVSCTFAQSGTILPDGFILPSAATSPGCTVADKGKMYYNSTSKLLMVCDGTEWISSLSQWSSPLAAPGTINTSRKVGINTTTPQYNLDVNGTVRVTGNLYAGSQIGVGTTTPADALQVTNGAIAISNTTDAKTWKFDYSDTENGLRIQEGGVTRMFLANGGNVGIGTSTPTASLTVNGSATFGGSITINNVGVVRSTTAASIKYHRVLLSLGTSVLVSANSCTTPANTANLSGAGFTAAPTVNIANVVSGTGEFGKLVATIQSVSTTSASIRLCNNTASNITLNSFSLNLICIGQ
jgi:hypothetical protein